MVALDIIHVAAAAFWLGGIAGLAVAFRSGAGPERVARMVARFSAGAVVSVLVLAGAGVAMAWIVLPSWDDLFSTGYGLALLTKVALVAVVVALGAFNNRRLVPAISAGAAASDQRRHLARIVRVELAVLLAVVGVTAVLVARSPVSSASAAPPPVTLPADAIELPLSGGVGTVAYTIAPGRAGTNELRLAFTDPAGQPLEPVEAPTVELTEPALELGPLRPLVHPLDVGEYHVIAEIPLAGTWEHDDPGARQRLRGGHGDDAADDRRVTVSRRRAGDRRRARAWWPRPARAPGGVERGRPATTRARR